MNVQRRARSGESPSSDELVEARALSEPRPTAGWSRFYGFVEEPVHAAERLRQFDELAHPTVLTWSDGLAVSLHPGEQLSRALYLSGTYEPNTLCVLRTLLQPGDDFIDVGAHAGVVSLAASRWVGSGGSVLSVEPSAREFMRLRESLALSSVTNVTPLRLAVGARSGRAALRVADDAHSGLNTLGREFAYSGVEASRLEDIEVVTLDDVVENRDVRRLAAIKLDCEGAETAALTGATRLLAERRPALLLEINAAALAAHGTDRRELALLLADAEYGVFTIDDATAGLVACAELMHVDEENVVALPRESRPENLSATRPQSLRRTTSAGLEVSRPDRVRGPTTRDVLDAALHAELRPIRDTAQTRFDEALRLSRQEGGFVTRARLSVSRGAPDDAIRVRARETRRLLRNARVNRSTGDTSRPAVRAADRAANRHIRGSSFGRSPALGRRRPRP